MLQLLKFLKSKLFFSNENSFKLFSLYIKIMSGSTVYIANDPNYESNCQEGTMWDATAQECMKIVKTESTTTPWWGWLLIIIAVLAVIGFTIWYIVWSTSTSNPAAQNSALSITGVDFKIAQTSMTATWLAVGDPNDRVTLFVAPSGQDSLKFGKDGTPAGNYIQAGPVAGSANTVTATGLQINTTYDAVLVVTNPNLPGAANVGNIESGLHTSGHSEHGPKFQIVAMNQGGSVVYDINTPEGIGPIVSYNRTTNSNLNSLFHHDNNGFICATTPGQALTADTPCADGSAVLYSGTPNLGTASVTAIASQSQLRMKTKSQLSETEAANARWQYNAAGDNRWCLINGNGCMNYNVTSPEIVYTTNADGTTSFVTLTPANGNTVTLAATSTNGNGTNNPFVPETTGTNQAIFVSAQGSKFRNEPYP